LSSNGFGVIAEAKLASPSEGVLAAGGGDRVAALSRAYAAGGAAAISVLTEKSRFGGAIDHLEAVAGSVDLPVMRKDFLVDPIQVEEARSAGASGVLLIARLLTGGLLAEMTDLTLTLGMFPLIEIFDEDDLEKTSQVFDRDVLIGVNCRDLTNLGVDRRRFEALAPLLPDGLPAVAESGLESPEDVAAVAALGYRLALVGTALVRSGDVRSDLESMIEAGRSAMTGAGR
jgi:indole-3-glycerol phosphate synthase